MNQCRKKTFKYMAKNKYKLKKNVDIKESNEYENFK